MTIFVLPIILSNNWCLLDCFNATWSFSSLFINKQLVSNDVCEMNPVDVSLIIDDFGQFIDAWYCDKLSLGNNGISSRLGINGLRMVCSLDELSKC